MEHQILGPWQQFGLIGLMIGAIVTLLFIIIKWTLATTKEILKQASVERADWKKTIDSITESIRKHDEKAEERGRYIREEHRQMIETLGRINGYKH